MINVSYSRNWRIKLGFTNQIEFKKYFKGKDEILQPSIDFEYINNLNIRVLEIVEKIRNGINNQTPIENIENFNYKIQKLQSRILENINTMNNNGRRKEEVYFSWMRGQIIMDFFIPSIEYIFDSKVNIIGDDTGESWFRTAKADLEVQYNNEIIRLEIQTGFQGINDIKKHKIIEAKEQFLKNNIKTFVIHFDFFNGYVAFVNLFSIDENDINWVSRERMEGQLVFNIPSLYFIWKLDDLPLKFKEILIMLEL